MHYHCVITICEQGRSLVPAASRRSLVARELLCSWVSLHEASEDRSYSLELAGKH